MSKLNVLSDRRACRALAPEDVTPRMFVCISHVVQEYVAAPSSGDGYGASPRVMNVVQTMPGHRPFLVIDVCLPYLFAKDADGDYATLDLRRHRLVRVSTRYARNVFRREKARARALEKRSARPTDNDDD